MGESNHYLKKLVEVSGTDLIRAESNWAKAGNSRESFYGFLGISWLLATPNKTYRMLPNAAKKVKLLCNPHGYTLIKMRKARKSKWQKYT